MQSQEEKEKKLKKYKNSKAGLGCAGKNIVDYRRGNIDAGGGEVRIYLRGADGLVAEEFLYYPQTYPGLGQPTGVSMPKIVEAERVQSALPDFFGEV